MFPSKHFSLFPPFPRTDRVFVAMSFDPRFDSRWTNVIAPAIENVSVDGRPLKPRRVDTRKVSDSILTEILDGVSSDKLVFADITEMGKIDEYPVRNGNVMYEIGLAHAVRLPEEVLLFRSDDARLLFDVSNVRINRYDPDGAPTAAIRQVSESIADALREIDLRKNMAVKSAVRSLGYDAWILLAESAGGLKHPVVRTVGDMLSNSWRRHTLTRLLDLGVFSSQYPKWSPNLSYAELQGPAEQMFEYVLTPFGKAVLEASGAELGMTPEILKEYAAHFEGILDLKFGAGDA